jgi:hypothetical protein
MMDYENRAPRKTFGPNRVAATRGKWKNGIQSSFRLVELSIQGENRQRM